MMEFTGTFKPSRDAETLGFKAQGLDESDLEAILDGKSVTLTAQTSAGTIKTITIASPADLLALANIKIYTDQQSAVRNWYVHKDEVGSVGRGRGRADSADVTIV